MHMRLRCIMGSYCMRPYLTSNFELGLTLVMHAQLHYRVTVASLLCCFLRPP